LRLKTELSGQRRGCAVFVPLDKFMGRAWYVITGDALVKGYSIGLVLGRNRPEEVKLL
jgi:hypothetical protein